MNGLFAPPSSAPIGLPLSPPQANMATFVLHSGDIFSGAYLTSGVVTAQQWR